MNPRQFFERVAFLREKQKEYYRTRDKEVLKQSIALEQEIDAEIARVRSILAVKEAMEAKEKPPDEAPLPPVGGDSDSPLGAGGCYPAHDCIHFHGTNQCKRKVCLSGGRFLMIPLCPVSYGWKSECPHYSPKTIPKEI